MDRQEKVGFGGGCHWCTEAVFQQLAGVSRVAQGYIASLHPNQAYSEGVIVYYNPERIPLEILLEIHLHTHAATKEHSFRKSYRSAMYYYRDEDKYAFAKALPLLQHSFPEPIITQALPFAAFKPSRESIQDYYKKNPEAPFCERYTNPKLKILQQKYGRYL